MSTFKIKPYENLPSTGSTTYGAIFTFCVKSGTATTNFESDVESNTDFIKYGLSTAGLTGQDIIIKTAPSKYIYIDRGNNIPYKNNDSMNSVKQTVNRTKVQLTSSPATYTTGIGTNPNGSGISQGDSIFTETTTDNKPKIYLTSALASCIKDISDVYQHLKYSNLTDTDAVAYFGANVDGDTSILTNPSQLPATILNTKLSGGGGDPTAVQPIDPNLSYNGDRFPSENLSGVTVYSIVMPPQSTAQANTYLEFNDSNSTTKLTSSDVGFTPLSLVIQSAAITSSAPTLTEAEAANPPTPVTPGAGVEYTNNNSMTLYTVATQYIQYNVQRNMTDYQTAGKDISYKPCDSNSAINLPPTTTFAVPSTTTSTPSAVTTFPAGPDSTNTIFTYVTQDSNQQDIMTSGTFINCEPYDSNVQGDADHNPGFTKAIQGVGDSTHSQGDLPYTTDITSATKQIVNSYTVDGETRWYTPILPSANSVSSPDQVTVSVGGSNTTVYTLNPNKLIANNTTIVLGDNLAATVSPCPTVLDVVDVSGTATYQVNSDVGVYLDGQAGSIPNITSFTNSALVVQSANSNS